MRFITKHKILNILTALCFTNAMVLPITQPLAYAAESTAETSQNASTDTSTQKMESAISKYVNNFSTWKDEDKEKFANEYAEYIYGLYRTGTSAEKQAYKDKIKNASSAEEAKAILQEGLDYNTNNIPSKEWSEKYSNWKNMDEFDKTTLLKERIDDLDKDGLLSKTGADNELIKQVLTSGDMTVKSLDKLITDSVYAQTKSFDTDNIPTTDWLQKYSQWENLNDADRTSLLKERISAVDKDGLLSKTGLDEDLVSKMLSTDGSASVKDLDESISSYITNQKKYLNTDNLPSSDWLKQWNNWNNLTDAERTALLKERISAVDKEGLLSKTGVDSELINKVLSSNKFSMKQLDEFIADYMKAQTQVNSTSSNATTQKCPTGYYEVSEVKKCCQDGTTYDTETQMCKTSAENTATEQSPNRGGGNSTMSTLLPLAGILFKGGGGSSEESITPAPEDEKEIQRQVNNDSFNKGIQNNYRQTKDVSLRRVFGTIYQNGKEDYLWDNDTSQFIFSSLTSEDEKQFLTVELQVPNDKFSVGRGVLRFFGENSVLLAQIPESPEPPQAVIRSNGNITIKRFAVPAEILNSPNDLGYDAILTVQVGQPKGSYTKEFVLNRAVKVYSSTPILGGGKTGAEVQENMGAQVTMLENEDDNWQKINIDLSKDVTYKDGVCSFTNDDTDGTEIQVKVGGDIKDADGCHSLNGKNFNKTDLEKNYGILDENNIQSDEDVPAKITDMTINVLQEDGTYKDVALLDARFVAGRAPDGTQYVIDTTTNKIYDLKNDPKMLNGEENPYDVVHNNDNTISVINKQTGEKMPLYSVGQAIDYSKQASKRNVSAEENPSTNNNGLAQNENSPATSQDAVNQRNRGDANATNQSPMPRNENISNAFKNTTQKSFSFSNGVVTFNRSSSNGDSSSYSFDIPSAIELLKKH